MARVFPLIFLGVAAFLLNVVMSRVIHSQREQVGVLKAFGYSSFDVGWHFTEFVAVIVLVGSVVGIGAGVWLGHGMSEVYREFFRFPYLEFALRPTVAMNAVLVSAAAALLGTLRAVRAVASLPPAEAMQPQRPTHYRETMLEKLGAGRLLDQPTRMILRHINRHPIKSLLTLTGIAFSVAIMMVGSFQEDAMDYMVNVQFNLTAREDLSVSFVEPVGRGALFELKRLPGIEHAEPFRSVPARLRFGHRSYRSAIEGLESGGELHRLLSDNLVPLDLPSAGIVLTDYLGEILGVRPGDTLTAEVLEGQRPVVRMPVAALVREYVGVSAYMDLSALNRLMREGHAISGAYLATDGLYQPAIYAELKETPQVAAVGVRNQAINSFYETVAETLLIFTFVNTLLAATIAFGVVYNNARIALSERGRELASLRELGFTRAEISYILLGELGLLTLAALPVGSLIGRELCRFIAEDLDSEIYRVPLVVEPTTYSFAASVVLLAAVVSSLMMKRKLDRLDLVAVLKTRE
jgi:putative ABC transport system permease protein